MHTHYLFYHLAVHVSIIDFPVHTDVMNIIVHTASIGSIFYPRFISDTDAELLIGQVLD